MDTLGTSDTKKAKRLLFRTFSLIALLTIVAVVMVIFVRTSPKLIIPELENEKGLQVFEDPRKLPEFSLLDQDNQPFTKQRLEEQWSIIFFGYTSCPDVCPTTLGVMDGASSLIKADPGDDNLPTQFIFVSVDPVRDTPLRLKEYIKYFNTDFIAATGKSNNDVDQLSKPMGAIYDFEDIKTNLPIRDVSKLSEGGGYLVNHFAGIYIIDPSARIAAVIFPPHDEKRFARIFRIIRSAYAEKD